MKSQQSRSDESKLFKINQPIATEQEMEAIASIKTSDIEKAIAAWRKIAPQQYQDLLEAPEFESR